MCEFKVHKLENRECYTIIDNTILRDKNISLKAKGLLCFILSLPPKWNFSKEGLCSCIKEGKTAIDTALKELETYGYLKITKTTKSGKFYSKYDFYAMPFEQYSVSMKKPNRKLRKRKPATEKPAQINTNKINTKSNKIIYRVEENILNDIKTKINYNTLVEKYEKYDIDKIVMIIVGALTSDEEDECTKNLLNSLTSYQIEHALTKAKSNSRKIRNYDLWVKKVLCNVPPEETCRIRETDYTNYIESEDGW